MAIATRGVGAIRTVIFDLDEALLVRAPAWRYAVEEAVAAATGRRVDSAPLAEEYRRRPWAHALAVLLDSPGDVARCEALCAQMYARSAMKRLLVHEGLGMALDRLRGDRVEMGAISREPHEIARRQIESTGLDRFLQALSAAPPGEPWDASARISDCLGYFERSAAQCVFVGSDDSDMAVAQGMGAKILRAAWADGEPGDYPAIESPGALVDFTRRGS